MTATVALGAGLSIGPLYLAPVLMAPTAAPDNPEPTYALTAETNLLSGLLDMIACFGTGSLGSSGCEEPGEVEALPVPPTTPVVDDTIDDLPEPEPEPEPEIIVDPAPPEPEPETPESETPAEEEPAPTTPAPTNPNCPATERLDGNQLQAEEMIARVTWLDANCANTLTTVVGHSYGSFRAQEVAEHFGPSYAGKTKFVLNAGPRAEVLSRTPKTTIINCNFADPVCDRQNGSPLTYLNHMPDKYPLSYDNHAPGYNFILANGQVSRPYDGQAGATVLAAEGDQGR